SMAIVNRPPAMASPSVLMIKSCQAKDGGATYWEKQMLSE
ncbi:hypothetical protein Tco_0851710, partial [Tanacetum coccineum]